MNDVAGDLFTLTDSSTAPNGAWSWFEDERAIVDDSDPKNPLLIASSVSAGSFGERGDIDLLWRNLNTGDQGEFELHNELQQDDHDSASLLIRPDGRYLAMYSEHGSDPFTRWRISTHPHDPTSWQPEQILDNDAGTTYNNTYYLPADNGGAGRLYNFTRTNNYDPNVQVSDDNGATWNNAGKLLTEGGGGDRPYVRYASDGKKIHLITTNRHPRDFQNSIFHGYVQDGVLYNSDGTVVDGTVLDSSGVAPSALTPIFENGTQFGGNTMTRAWTISLELDNTGNPVGIFSTRVEDDASDHRFFYARHDGADWQVNEMAHAGAYLYGAERDYTGLASVDPNNPNVVYMSSEVDPRNNSATNHYEMYKGVTTDFGESWTWTPITEDSTMDNIRPVVPEWNGQNTAVTWLRGTYNSYTNWDTDVVGLAFAATDPKALLWRGDAGNSWDVGGTANWDSGGGTIDGYQNGDEVAFDDTADSYQVHLPSAATPMGMAFNNAIHAYTVTGAGIEGAGRLRVIGGGTVTLANGDNTYTGETTVARGTLALAGSATVSATPRIHVASDGTLDVTATDSGSYTIDHQHLTVEGVVEGDLVAAGGSTIDGAGRINGKLSADDGSLLQVGGSAILAEQEFRYVDATPGAGGNTTLADGSTFVPPGNPNWLLRTGFANDGDFYQGDSSDPSTAPELKTTLTGLEPGQSYTVYVNYWDATGSAWRILAGETSGSLTLFDSPFDNVSGATDGVDPETLRYENAPLTAEGNRLMWGGYLGDLVADENGEIAVFIDDTGTNDDNDGRTWYDGLSISSDVNYSGEATMTVDGDFTQSSGATLSMDIATSDVHDRFVVTGAAQLAGRLEVALADGAPAPQIGDTFDLLAFTTATGSFEVVDLPGLGPDRRWDVSNLAVDGSIAVAAALDGDFNGDGIVDLADYSVWRDNLGAVEDSAVLAGNGTHDGTVGLADYTLWKSNFGATLGSNRLTTSHVAVPEPMSMHVISIALLFGALRWCIV